MNQDIKPASLLDAEEAAAAGENADAVRSFRLLTFVSQRLRHLFDRRLRTDQLTTQQGFLLTLVRKLDRPTLGQVATAMTTTHQNAKQIAAALERKGMLSIVADPNDARLRRLEATSAGQSGWVDRNEDDFAVIGDIFAVLTPSERATLVSLLGRVARSLVDRESPDGKDRPGNRAKGA